MPGVKKEDIEITIEGLRVAIAAKTETKTEANEGDKALRTERFTAYARTFQLPVEVSEAGAQASYDSGVLTLTLAKRVPLVGRRVEVH
jgi:HSP20 family protein